jgi:hypothetical protein
MQFLVTARHAHSSGSQVARVFVSAVQTLPVGAVVACAVALAWREHGSIDAQSWLPYSIGIALVGAIVLTAGVAARPTRASALGIAAFAAFALWAILTGWWAPSASLARDEGLLTATYAVAFGIAVVTLWTPDRRLGALGTVAAASGGLAIATAAVLVWGDAPLAHYYGGRVAFPISYVNATGALFAVGIWPSIALAARRTGNVVVRALALGAAAASLGGVLMTQSKGAVLGLIVATAVVFAVSPARLRLVPPFAIAGVIGALAFHRLSEPFRVYSDESIRRAGAACLTLAMVAVLVGLPYALLDANVTVSRRTSRRFGVVLLVAVAAAVVGGVALFFTRVHDPGGWVAGKWRAAHTYSTSEKASTHLLQVGSNRFDFWRVAIGEFERHPVVGEGARAFGPAYLMHGNSAETPRRAHSLPLEVLAEQGVVGFGLFAVAIGAPLLLALRRARRGDVVAAAALGGVLAWGVQCLVDWVWTLPATTILAIVLLGVGASARDGRGAVAPRVARGVAVGLVAAAVLAFAPPWLAARYTDRGVANRSTADLHRARRLDPLSTAPLLAATTVEPLRAALPDLERAARQEPGIALNRYVLGAAYLQLGRKADARAELAAANRLKPGDPLIRSTLARAR